MRNSLCLVLCVSFSLAIQAQELIPVGTWRSHFNYNQAFLVEQTNAKVFAATPNGLMFYDSEDQSINKLSKVDGLGDVGISALKFDFQHEYLAIGYHNGNVDIINDEGITNLPVLLNSSITENKRVNHISFYDQHMNLATDFGLIVLTVDGKVEEAYQNLGENGEVIKVKASAVQNDMIYLATQNGVLAGRLAAGINLQDFNNWERFTTAVVHLIDMISVASINGIVYASSESTLYKLEEGIWAEVALVLASGEAITKVREGVDQLLILTNQRVLTLNASNVISEINQPFDASINDLSQSGTNEFWYADQSKGLTRLNGTAVEHLVLDGPLNDIEKLKVVEGGVYAFPTKDLTYSNPVSNSVGYSIFTRGRWETKQPAEIEGLTNISDVIGHDSQTFIASFGQGILSQQNSQVIDHTNSPLEENAVGTGNSLVSAMAMDQTQNIWIANFSNYSLLKWDGNSDWARVDLGSFAAMQPNSLAINTNGQAWMSLGLTSGLGVWAYDIESDQSRHITSSVTNLPSNTVNDIAFGKDGEIWFATDLGMAYFPFSFGVIEDQSVDLTLPIYEESALFEGKKVNALAVDGGNRIWIGTQDGLWLFGENIDRLVYHFTVQNSPLPSNSVTDLAIHPETGELFIATIEGIVSYRTDATEGTQAHSLVKIFPNPVLPNYQGWVGFSGLARNARLKITNVSGELVREVNATGGGASWDINDYSGRRVDSGVYLVFSATPNGTESFVGKVAVID